MQIARGKSMPRHAAGSASSNATRKVRWQSKGSMLVPSVSIWTQLLLRQILTIGAFLLQATNMIATGPKPPLSFNSSNDEAPIKLDIGGGMGEQRYVELSKQAVPLT